MATFRAYAIFGKDSSHAKSTVSLGCSRAKWGPLSSAYGFTLLEAHERLSVRLDRSQKYSLSSLISTLEELGTISQKNCYERIVSLNKIPMPAFLS